MPLLLSTVGSPDLLGGLLTENTFSPGPKFSPKRKTEVPTQICNGKDLLWALCVFQTNKKLDKYAARCVLYLEDFCLIWRDAVFGPPTVCLESRVFDQVLSVLSLDSSDIRGHGALTFYR